MRINNYYRLPRTVETGNSTHVNSAVAIQAVVTKQAFVTATNKGSFLSLSVILSVSLIDINTL